MDEILVANFMVFLELVEEEHYDVWVGDEAWDLDHHLHENPELKRAPFAWLTDFVGMLPVAGDDAREAAVAADLNAEMVEHVARFPYVRDRSIFIGEPEDVVPGRLGPGLPGIREWTEEHFSFVGYVADPRPQPARAELREALGWGADERVCVVTAGGSGAGEHLLRLAIEAHADAAERVGGLRTVVVAGPRIAPDTLPAPPGVEVAGYVHELRTQLAACDLAIVHGGLATTMELTAAARPFIYLPLRRHFEQRVHVHHRLERHGAGRPVEIDEASPAMLAEAIAAELGREVAPRPVEAGGARRAAGLIAELL
jgi:predicted glycosyltransferase